MAGPAREVGWPNSGFRGGAAEDSATSVEEHEGRRAQPARRAIEVPDAVRYLGSAQARAKVVITVS
jgi:hypothetical protein